LGDDGRKGERCARMNTVAVEAARALNGMEGAEAGSIQLGGQVQDESIGLVQGGAAHMHLTPRGQEYVGDRERLIEWLFFQTDRLRLQRSTAYAAVFLMDRYASTITVSRSILRLTAATCLWISAKYDEPDENMITSQQLERMCDGDYPVRFFRRMEKQVLNQLNWSVASASAYHFLHYFTQRSNVRRAHVAWNAPDVSTPYSHTQKVLEMCIKDATFLKFSPVMLAASLLYCQYRSCTVRAETLSQLWDSNLVRLTGYTIEDLDVCVRPVRQVWEQCLKPESGVSPRSVLDGNLMCDEQMDGDSDDDDDEGFEFVGFDACLHCDEDTSSLPTAPADSLDDSLEVVDMFD